MEKAYQSQGQDLTMSASKTLEINPDHPVVTALANAIEKDRESAAAKDQCELMYDVAALTGGYTIEDPGAFATRVISLMGDKAGGASIANAEVVASSDDAADEPTETAEVEVVEP